MEIDPPRRLVLKWRNEFRLEMKTEGFSRCVAEIVAAGEAVKLTITHASVGKTSPRILQFIAMAVGKNLTGHHVFHRCRVLIVGLEDSRAELQRRIAAACIHHRIPKADLKGWLHYVTIEELKGMKLATMSPLDDL